MNSTNETAGNPAQLPTPSPRSPQLPQLPQLPQAPAIPSTRQTWPGWLGALLLILATVLAYIPAMRAGFIWDDDAYVYRTDRDVITQKDGLERIWTTAATPQWYPMVFTTYWLEYRLWGAIPNEIVGKNEPQLNGARAWFNPIGYHVVNILLHALSAVLLWQILVRLKVPGAWLAAAIFAVHPVHVESVAWITERKNTLSVFFYMTALLAYLRFANRESFWWYLIALPAFVLALFSKTVTCTLPVAVLLALWLGGSLGLLETALLVPGVALLSSAVVALLLKHVLHIRDLAVVFNPFVTLLKEHGVNASFMTPGLFIAAAAVVGLVATVIALWRARRRVSWIVPVGLVPFFVAGIFMGKLTGWYEFHRMDEEYYEPIPIVDAFRLSWTEGAEATQRSEYKLSNAQRAIIAARSLLFYPEKLLAPYPQSFFYHRWNETAELNTAKRENFWPLAAVAGVGALVVVLSVIYGRGIFIAFAFFVVTLFPALGFYDTYPMRYSFVADHFQYLASIGLTTLLAAGLALLFKRLGGTPIPAFNGATVPAGLLALALVVGLGAKTAWRCQALHDEETLWLDTIAKTPDAWGARVNLGILYGNKGSELVRKAAAYAKQGDQKASEEARKQSDEYLDKAAEQFRAIIDGGQKWQEAPSNLGNIYAMRRQFPEATRLYRMAVDYEPRLPTLRIQLAKLLLLQKKEAEALAVYEEAAKVPPETYVWPSQWPKVFEEWAKLLEKTGQKDKAVQQYAHAATMLIHSAEAAEKRERFAEAARDLESAAELLDNAAQKENAAAQYTRAGDLLIRDADALEKRGRIDQAARRLDRAAEVQDKAGQTQVAAKTRARAAELRATLASSETAQAKAGSGTQPAVKIDLGGATTVQERRRAYLNELNNALLRRDYVYAMQVVEAGRQEFPASIGLLKKWGLLTAASPIDTQRDAKQAVWFAETLRTALAKQNAVDAETLEILGAAYAAAGDFGNALNAANEGLRLAQAGGDPLIRNRLQAQIRLYQARQVYRLPVGQGSAETPPPATTQPSAAPTPRPSRAPTTRPAPAAAWPIRAPATRPVRSVATRPAMAR
jgi:tetratricopeptide (TPR) repeat protein